MIDGTCKICFFLTNLSLVFLITLRIKMIAAGLILIVLSLVYFGYMLNRFKKTGFMSLTTPQKFDFFGNILIVLFFTFLGTMFILNNIG